MTKNQQINLLTYFGHHKAASSWIEAIILNVCADMGIKHGLIDRPSLYNYTYPEPIGYLRTIRYLSEQMQVQSLISII